MKKMIIFYFAFVMMHLISSFSNAQFTNITATLEDVNNGSLEWGDYDKDGDLDLLLSGDRNNYPFTPYTYLYKNNSGIFTGQSSGMTYVESGDLCWGDYDNDGDLDVAMAGWVDASTRITKIYKNNSGSFSNIGANLYGVDDCSMDWGDFDNDGDLDLLLSGGLSGSGNITKIYENNQGVFSLSDINFAGMEYSSVKWGDYDNDGDLDFLICGSTNGASADGTTKLYQNNSGFFTEINTNLVNVANGSVDWGDYDSDGDLDILLTGFDSTGNQTRIYENTVDSFTDIGGGITSFEGPGFWGDFDNDGDLDALLCSSGRIIENDSGIFSTTLFDFSTWFETATLGDYDGDGDLDIATLGIDQPGIWRNDIAVTNSAPVSPLGLTEILNGNKVSLQWNKATDSQTPQNGLNYNIVVSTTSGGTEIVGPLAFASNGKRLVSKIGNTNLNNSWSISNLQPGTYYWKVQTIDNCFVGSAFSSEKTFDITIPAQPMLAFPPQDTVNQDTVIIFQWNQEPAALNYWFQLATDSLFINLIADDSTSFDTSYVVGSLILNTKYYWKVRAQNGSGWSFWSETFDFRTYYPYVNLNAGLTGVYDGEIEWGDYDNDNDLDLFVVGRISNYPSYTTMSSLYQNNSGVFSVVNDGAPNLGGASMEWGDYDNDGDLDYVITGISNSDSYLVGDIYTNNNGVFTVLWNNPVNDVFNGSLDWGDYDNDGDLDILLTGAQGLYPNNNPITRIIRKDSINFVSVNVGLPGICFGDAGWGDYNNDGKLDIILAGIGADGNPVTALYENHSDTFIFVSSGIDSVSNASIEWGDYDVDGDMDLLVIGSKQNLNISKVFQNNNGTFTDIGAQLMTVSVGNGSWGDYDNDGDLDILITGQTGYVPPDYIYDAKIYINNNGIFSETQVGIEAAGYSYSAWGDYDNDGDIDLAVCGVNKSNSNNGVTQKTTTIYRRISGSNSYSANSFPSIPSGQTYSSANFQATLSWNKSTDIQTPQNALTYNLSIANDPMSVNIMSPRSNVINGYPKTPGRGNAQSCNSWQIRNLRPGRFYWKVQSVDQCYAGSPFSTIDSFTVFDPSAPTLIYPYEEQDPVKVNETMKWTSFSNAASYHLQIAFDSLFSDFFLNDSNITDTILPINNFILNRHHYWRTRAKTGSAYSNWSFIRHFYTRHNPTPVAVTFPEVYFSELAWGDYDNDGDLDLVISGKNTNSATCGIYRNDGNDIFTDIGAGIAGFWDGSADWADFDNDDDLDLLMTGYSNNIPKVILYRNDNGIFNDHNAGFTGVIDSDADWGDYDNDGDLDVIIVGDTTSNWGMASTKLYNNQNGVFTPVNTSLTPADNGSVQWGDYDKDGDLDLSLMGRNPNPASKIFRNDGNGVFFDINADLELMDLGVVKWGDYDNDGDLDLLQVGKLSGDDAYIYRNDANSFININADFPNNMYTDAAWGDYENDGDLDIVFTAAAPNYSNSMTSIYINNNGIFDELRPGFESLVFSAVSWGDYDNDGDLDIVMSGQDTSGVGRTYLYRNNARQNIKPSPPNGLNALIVGNQLNLSWNPSSDYETPSNSLGYIIKIGTTPGGNEICSPMTDSNSGFRRIVKAGNTNLKQGWVINNLPPGATYYWSVQAVDDANECSSASPENVIFIPTGIEFPATQGQISVYPVPASNTLSLVLSEIAYGPVECRITNLCGKLLATQIFFQDGANSTFRIDITKLEEGMKILEVSTKNSKNVVKIVKID